MDSSQSSMSMISGGGKNNKDILGMLGDDLDNQTYFMCEEWFPINFYFWHLEIVKISNVEWVDQSNTII